MCTIAMSNKLEVLKLIENLKYFSILHFQFLYGCYIHRLEAYYHLNQRFKLQTFPLPL